MNKKIKAISGLLGLTGVTLGALGAHALGATLAARSMATAWETAVIYHLIHAVAVFAVAVALPCPRPWLVRAAICWAVGVVLFSGSLYALALGGPHWLGPVTPLGGLAFLLGWSFVIIDGLCDSAPKKS
ncbi:MAG TPA: DUF423 domain-containing protein [Opitutaceae bacterium]|jgi:uncharacterized membrane protein YgdD (TMEM256/DUF423 family)|nr:DUF423 domain-containing protein [Opitutaceae bacterium]